MTDLLEAIEYFKEVVNKQGEPYFNMVKAVAENLRDATEREQIEDAYDAALRDSSGIRTDDLKFGAKYYQQKYGDEK